ncbi:RNA pseudouridine synthase [Helicobacter anseris]|uniref:RNA pseudouridylate synthase n=1 Tax=Helicobacter anseris TaxID=375926 RepID=A0A3D8J6T1_9HELI|nr:RluA family pseudouridine synthase [Helicobacter anseris]RDU73199.1 RNA pseudouridine synthase [Helicobacter anseris]
MNKAYKILSIQENISHKKAKEMIDKGMVSFNGKKITLARAEFPEHTIFEIQKIKKPEVIFEDKDILVINKPPFIESYELASFFKEWVLLHRLDRETSGVILLVKENTPFHISAKKAFREQKVYKEYHALVSGFISEKITINQPILTIKKGFAKSKISKEGLSAITDIEPVGVVGKKTLVKAVIKTGRTHQIRVHLKSIGHSIVGDKLYGGIESKRIMLHASRIKIFDYDFKVPLSREFEIL